MRVARQAMVLVLGFAGVAVPGIARADPPTVIVNPSWDVRPSPDYPRAAIDARVSEGTVALRCIVQPTGQVSDCTVTSETPSGYGFGEAAIRGAASARLNPRTVDGVATGASVTFSVRFAFSNVIAADYPIPPASDRAAFDCELLETGAFTDCRLDGVNPFDEAWTGRVTAIIARANFGRPRDWTVGMRRTLVFGSGPSGDPVALEVRPSSAPQTALVEDVAVTSTSSDPTTGEVDLRCRVLETGRLTDCVIEREEPQGAGFGAAALRGAASAQLAESDEWRPGSTVRFTTRFALTD